MASSKRNYDVFLNFRGEVRNNFLSHLYADLYRNGIRTFKDSEELWKGEEISLALMTAIEESRIAIIIFSEDYASSRWCLEELVKIMECKAQKDLIVLPVFYKVEPKEVREGRAAYIRAMAKHETKYGKDSETVKRWKKVLFDAGSLFGWELKNGDEAEFIRGIVKQVSSHLERKTPLYVAKYPVGIDSRVQEVISLSQKKSDGDDVLMIGIWGLGGIGKTAIARAIYNAIEREFEGSCFLDQVRETSNKCNGLVELQGKILSQTLSPEHPKASNEGKGCSSIMERLCHKKVLLVLDDVDNRCQLDMLVGGGHWFGKGSRIFVTTRNRHLVISSHCKNCVFSVKTLNEGEAQELFEWHAFQNSKKSEIGKDLIDRALHYASGLPLALEVLGSDLRAKDEPVWESKLGDLSNCPGNYIDQILKISFDGLEDNKKEIFLDIACFFKGKSIDYITEVLDGCGFKTTAGIDNLIDKSLIRIEHETLQIHDLIQLMGKNIVMRDNLGQRSRLWLFEDVLDILCEKKGTEAIQAIVVDLLTPEEIDLSLEEITIEADALKKMTNLRMLILPEARITSSEGRVRHPTNLRWTKWPNAPLPEFGSGPKKLIGLDLQKSHIKQLDHFKRFGMLKYINFSQCKSLDSVPDISSAPILKRLNLDGCKSLTELHQSVACHDKLEFLSLQFCSDLRIFPNMLETKSLRALDLSDCTKLEKFSNIPEKMENLEELDLGGTAIKELPASVENLVSLKMISLRKCKKLTTLPSNVYKWQNLEHLNLVGCFNLVTFPKNLEDSNNPNGNLGFRKLKVLELDGCNLSEVEFLESSSSFPKLSFLGLSGNKFTHLPTCIDKYKYLQHLYVDKCKQLQKIPQLPPNVHVLSANCCRSLQEFPDLSSLSSNCCCANLSSCRKLFRKGANMAHALSLEELPKMRKVNILLIGGEMPEWFFHRKDSSISFTVPWDLLDEFLGLALCVVFGPEGGKGVDVFFYVRIRVNGEVMFGLEIGVESMESDHVWIEYFWCEDLGIVARCFRDDCNHLEVEFIPQTGASLKKCGFRPICKQQEDDLRIVRQTPQPLETNRPLEESDSEEDNRTDTKEEESSSETDDEAIDHEKEKQGLFKADKIGPSEESDSEEDNRTDIKEEENSSETDDELIDQEKGKRGLFKADKIGPSEERDSEEDNRINNEEEESSSETDDELVLLGAIDQEKEKPGLFKADKIGPSEERDSEEDNWINTEEEESSNETDDEHFEEDRFDYGQHYKCEARRCLYTQAPCRSLKTLARPRLLKNEIPRY